MIERLETKASLSVNEAGEITALAWPFASADRENDRITPGAFGKIDLPIPMLAFHDMRELVGEWHEAAETPEGLVVKGRLDIEGRARARQLRGLIMRGAVRGVSIGFRALKSLGTKGVDRVISALDLSEISIVPEGMHPGARIVAAKSATDAIRLAEAINRAASALRSN